MIGGGPTPTDQSLYEKVKARVKKHFQKHQDGLQHMVQLI